MLFAGRRLGDHLEIVLDGHQVFLLVMPTLVNCGEDNLFSNGFHECNVVPVYAVSDRPKDISPIIVACGTTLIDNSQRELR